VVPKFREALFITHECHIQLAASEPVAYRLVILFFIFILLLSSSSSSLLL